MKAPSDQIIEDLQTTCQLLAHLAGQYQVDARQLKAMDLKWLAKCVKTFYQGSECFLRKFIDRILYFGKDPEYDAGTTAGSDSVEEILTRAGGLVYAAHDQLCEFRKRAWETKADYTPDIYEHAIHELEHQAIEIEKQLELLKTLGDAGYIGSRLEDE